MKILRYRLIHLFAFIAILAIPLWYVSSRIRAFQAQRIAIDALRAGDVGVQTKPCDGPLRWVLDPESYVTVEDISNEYKDPWPTDINKHFASILSVEGVYLGWSEASDDELAAIARIPGLKVLDLSDTKVTARGIAHLGACDSLESLRLFAVTLKDFSAISKLCHLKVLDISSTEMDDRAFRSLILAATLEELVLQNNDVESLSPLKDLHKLRYLNADYCPIRRGEVKHLRNCESLSALYIAGRFLGDEDIEQLAQLRSIEVLCLVDNACSAKALASLGELPCLKRFLCNGQHLDELVLSHWKALPLESLVLSGTDFEPESAALLAQFPSVKSLDLTGSNVTYDELVALKGLTTLRRLYVGDTQFPAEVIAQLRQQLTGVNIKTHDLKKYNPSFNE